MATLVLGPLLRYVGETEAVVWVETDEACEVEVLGHREPTFCVAGHHYALLIADGLEPGSATEYEVALDGERRWPEPGSEYPPSVIRTLGGDEPLRLAFGSCRVSLPHHGPYVLPKQEHSEGREFDALYTLVVEMLEADPAHWPRALLMLGDQVYADEVSPETLAFIRKRRDVRKPPGDEVADFEEYTRLYRESWEDSHIRWLLSTVSISMVIDDHDVHDDWNISAAWVEEMQQEDWWAERECAGLASYWLYQFIGNLSPRLIRESDLLARVREAEDGWEVLREFAANERGTRDGARWSYCRDLGSTRLLVIDSRIGRVLDEDRRSMLNPDEWSWLESHLSGDFEHLLIGTSDPLVLAPALHYAERWGEAVSRGAWGAAAARQGEKLRRAADLDHWPAFGESFDRLAGLLARVGAGEFGHPPASITVLSGDVHHAYLAELAYPSSDGVRSHVWQAVCSPFRNALDDRERKTIDLGDSRVPARAFKALARLAGAPRERVRWRLRRGPVLRQPGRDPDPRRPFGRAEAGAHRRRPGDRRARAPHLVRA